MFSYCQDYLFGKNICQQRGYFDKKIREDVQDTNVLAHPPVCLFLKFFLIFSRLPLLREGNQEKGLKLEFLLNLYFCEGLDDITCLNIVTVNE